MAEEAAVDSEVQESVAVEEPTENEGEATNATDDSSQSAGESSGDDWWDTTGLDDNVAERIKSIQREYNKKSEATKTEAQRAQQLEQQLNSVTQEVRNALLAPDWEQQVNNVRTQLLGVQAPQQQAAQMPQPKRLETQEDFNDYIATVLDWQRGQLSQEFDAKLSSEIRRIATPIEKERWIQADRNLRSQYPDLYDDEVSARVLQQVGSGPYQGLISKGMDEKQVLETAFLATYKDRLLTNAQQKALASLEAKKKASTERPRKSTSTASSGDKSKDDLIQELRESGYSFES